MSINIFLINYWQNIILIKYVAAYDQHWVNLAIHIFAHLNIIFQFKKFNLRVNKVQPRKVLLIGNFDLIKNFKNLAGAPRMMMGMNFFQLKDAETG